MHAEENRRREVTTREQVGLTPLNVPRSLLVLLVATIITASCGPGASREPDLPEQPDRWVSSISLDPDSKASYIGKTRDYVVTTVTSSEELDGLRTVSVGDEIEGLSIGAIRCSFFWRDASYGGDQYMWRGRWGCRAGRSREEVQNAVAEDGEKRFDYVYVTPVSLDGE